MSARGAGRLAWTAAGLSLACGVVTTVLLASIPAERLPAEDRLDVPDVLFALAFVAYAAVGALIVSTHPRNRVGWLFCAIGTAFPATGLLWAYAAYGRFARSSGLPGDEITAWTFAWSSDPLLVLLVLLLLLFPTGSFVSRRWRLVGVAALALATAWAAALALDPGPLYNFDSIPNPLGIDAAGGVLETVASLSSVALSLLVIGAALSMIARYRRADVVERQQIKWLAAAAGFGAVMVLALTTLSLAVDDDRGAWEVITSILAFLAIAALPIGAGIGILRHRLYDIDVVIRRTLVYGALTASLALVYVGSVLLLQLLLRPLTEESDLAIAGSTLAVAAVFRPLRSRVQAAVDRRFYRRRYDAARTLEAFSSRLRDELDLDALGGELRGVVRETMQPGHVSLWLREAER